MLFLLDGVDGVGKSTLATRIAEYLHEHRPTETVEVWHAGKPTQHPLDEYVAPLIAYRPRTQRHIICDRWHWGESVYPRVRDRDTQLNGWVNRYVELFLQSRGALGVHVWRDHAEVQDVFRDRGEFVLTETELTTTQRLFSETMRRSEIHKVTVRPDEVGVVEYLVAEASRAELRSRSLNGFTTYVGPSQVDTLVLGDVRGPGQRHVNGPAFMPYPSTSGAFLMRALYFQRVSDENVGIANACDVDSIADLVSITQPYNVVTLGRNAYDAYVNLFGPDDVGAVPHPQYVRRFHNKHHAEYGAILVEAAYTRKDQRSWRP